MSHKFFLTIPQSADCQCQWDISIGHRHLSWLPAMAYDFTVSAAASGALHKLIYTWDDTDGWQKHQQLQQVRVVGKDGSSAKVCSRSMEFSQPDASAMPLERSATTKPPISASVAPPPPPAVPAAPLPAAATPVAPSPVVSMNMMFSKAASMAASRAAAAAAAAAPAAPPPPKKPLAKKMPVRRHQQQRLHLQDSL